MLKVEKKNKEVKVLKTELRVFEETIVTLRDIPVIGTVELLDKAVAFLSVSWDGHVDQLLTKRLEELHPSWFETVDKGGFGLFGVNKEGKVIYAISYFQHGVETKQYDSKDKPCYLVLPAKETYPYIWEK